MELGAEKDWKKKIGFPINYDSSQSSDDDFGVESGERTGVVVRRAGRGAGRGAAGPLLADAGDGAEADLLGSTPPRARIRDKEKRRPIYRSNTCGAAGGGLQRVAERPAAAPASSPAPHAPERLRKRASLKLIRARDRDHKADRDGGRAESLPSPIPGLAAGTGPAPPTLVESCSRFMSLSSRLKCSAAGAPEERAAPRGPALAHLPPSRVSFHSTFSMLINMGNIDKGCKRTVSREEQVWQNELKDLIWLALRARLAGRSLAQQDAFLCAQRRSVPALLQTLLNYRFVNPFPCPGAADEEAEAVAEGEAADTNLMGGAGQTCLSAECARCVASVGRGMREVRALLEAVEAAEALYPSACAAEADQPELASAALKHRIRAMCVWYNTSLHMRLKLVALRRLVRESRARPRALQHLASTDSTSDYSRKSSVSQRSAHVRFAVSGAPTPTDSSGSDLSAHSDAAAAPTPRALHDQHAHEHGDVLDSGIDSRSENFGDTTPEIIISGSASPSDEARAAVGEAEGTGGAAGDVRGEGGGAVRAEATGGEALGEAAGTESDDDPLVLGSLLELTQLRLLGKASVPPYRDYHHELLKTQGVRRCMAFINKISQLMLRKVYLTLLQPEESGGEFGAAADGGAAGVAGVAAADENTYVLRRYGCWSPESVAMQLPTYRSHFILLNCVCMEAVHDILTLRLDTRPAHPSCLTVKQLIHELKEELDIATEIRSSFVLHVAAALRGVRGRSAAQAELRTLLRTYDHSLDTTMQQYLSYLTTIADTEALPRAALAAEWAFAARLAARAPRAAAPAPQAFVDIACRQLRRLVRRFDDRFADLAHVDTAAEPEGLRYTVFALCRAAQQVYAGEREAVLQAAQAARALAARLPRRHRALRAPLYEELMLLRDCLVRHTENILEQSTGAVDAEPGDSTAARVRELLLQGYKLGFEVHKELHRLANEAGAAEAETDTVEAGAGAPEAGGGGGGGRAGRGRGARLARAESVTEEGAFDCRPFDSAAAPHRDADDLEEPMPGEEEAEEAEQAEGEEGAGEEAWAAQVARAVIQFARCWMRFVVERCERGRGLRPRWASQGLEFLMLACDPWNTRHLTDDEFEELKQMMDGCISHVIGSRAGAQAEPPRRPRRRLHSPLPAGSGETVPACPVGPAAPPSPPPDLDQSCEYAASPEAERCAGGAGRRVLEAVLRLDAARDAALRERRLVGRALPAPAPSYEPKLRQLKFKWQRGLKIGAGTFGKVYTVVNTESGQLLAMKELSVGAGDRRALQRAANELRVLEGVLHPHLVRYYGCELHREEMLLFMELCVEGSLEALVGASGALAEPTVRRYTKQLVSAVAELHARGIAHRDIKSGNIFLTNEGHCLKLGDFGCAVKIRANTTAPGELQGFVGTQAYMAPEVFMKSSGHGRAADVWSLGCVVTEMATGKRPFPEYDSNYQIMFVVGMGGRPALPDDALSPEGRDFCARCLTHDPDLRPRAADLAHHHFLLVKADEDCKCEPAYLIA